MKRYAVLLVMVLLFSGCSVLPRITFDRPNTVPQKTEKVQKVVRCKGDIELDDLGRVISCKGGFYSTEKTYNQEERKLTLKERFLNFLANLKGYFFWVVVLLFFFAPGVLSFILGRFIEGVFGVSRKALESTVRAIKKAKSNGGQYLKELEEEHNKDPKVKKVVNQIRAEVSAK